MKFERSQGWDGNPRVGRVTDSHRAATNESSPNQVFYSDEIEHAHVTWAIQQGVSLENTRSDSRNWRLQSPLYRPLDCLAKAHASETGRDTTTAASVGTDR